MDVSVVLALCAFCFMTLGVEIDKTCRNTNCTQQKRFEGDTLFPCTILNKKGWETFRDKHGLQERYEYRKSSINFLPPVITAVKLYKTIVNGNVISPNMNITFTYTDRSEIKAILLKFAGFCNGDMVDPYYCTRPVYLLFDFSLYRPIVLNQHHTRELFYQCIMGLENRGDASSKWSYNVMLTAFTMKPENPGISITYRLTSYNNRFKIRRFWKPGILTTVMPGTHDVHVVFERLPPSWVQKNTYYKVVLISVDSDSRLIILSVKNNSCTFKNTKKGTFSIRVIAHKCHWKKTCAIGVSYNFNVTTDKQPLVHSQVAIYSETNKTSAAIIQERNITISATYQENNPSNVTIKVNHWRTYAVIGAIIGLILAAVFVFGVCIFTKENADRIKLILACDHYEHREEEQALKSFLQQTLKFQTSDEDVETSNGAFNVFMLCEQSVADLVNAQTSKLLDNGSGHIIFAQMPDRLPYELRRGNCVFEWPVEVEKLLNHLYGKKVRHFYYPWLKYHKMKDYRSTYEYQSLINTLSYPEMTVDSNDIASQKEENEVNKFLDTGKSKERSLYPLHLNVNQSLIKPSDLSNHKTTEKIEIEHQSLVNALSYPEVTVDSSTDIASKKKENEGNTFLDPGKSKVRCLCPEHRNVNQSLVKSSHLLNHNTLEKRRPKLCSHQCEGKTNDWFLEINPNPKERYSTVASQHQSHRHRSHSDSFPSISTDDVYINERINTLGLLKENDPLVDDSSQNSDSNEDIVRRFLEINEIQI